MNKMKNMKSKILLAISFLAVVFVTSSCLKDDIGINWADDLKGKMYAEFPSNGANTYVIQPVAADQVFKFLVNIATDELPKTDVTFTFDFDPTAMAAYNTELKKADPNMNWSYRMYPGAVINDKTLTIKADTRRNAYVHVKLPRADTLNLENKYMVPITITSVTGGVIIAANKKTVLYRLPLANKWEGTYKLKGWILREGDPVLTGHRKNITVKLATLGPNSVVWESTHIWGDGASGVGGIGNWEITIDESTVPNKISLVDPANPAVKLNPDYPNRYEPSEKTFYIDAYWGAGINNRREIDTLVYYGPY
ncbi:MAG TPA: hypothetical protein DDW27_19530 [Bacteroidales bacterium]|nr:hypothetical protein [Bacteroidales bacterium]